MEFIQKIRNAVAGNKKIAIASAVAAVLVIFGVTGYFIFSDKWVAKINGEKITLSEFNDLYYAYHRSAYDKSNEEIDKIASNENAVASNPLLKRTEFLTQMIDQLVMFQAAVEAGFQKNPDAIALAENQRLAFVARFHAVISLKDKIKVTDQEVTEAYTKNKAQFKGAPLEQAAPRIRMVISQQKFGVEQNKKMKELRESAKIVKNEEMIKNLSNPDSSKRPKSGTLVTIKGSNIKTKEIDVKDFLTGYYAEMKLAYKLDEAGIDKLSSDPIAVKQNPVVEKEKYLEQAINLYLFHEDARVAGTLKNPDVIALTDFYNKQIVSMYYVNNSYAKETEVTPQEISAEYARVKSSIPPNALPDLVEASIKQKLQQQKLMAKLPQIISSLKDKATKEKNVAALEIKSSK